MSWPWDGNQLELEILAQVWRLRHVKSDRFPPGLKMDRVDPGTGLPLTANDIRPTCDAVRGDSLALEAGLIPDRLAREMLGLLDKPRLDWTEEESTLRSALEDRIQALFIRWKDRGYLLREPPIIIEESLDRIDDDRPCHTARMTRRGLEYAEKMMKNHPELRREGQTSILWGFTPEDRRAAPQYEQRRFLAEGGHLDGD